MLTYPACSTSRAWVCTSVLRLHHRQTWLELWHKRLIRYLQNKWLCNVQLLPRVWIFEISRKPFRISFSGSGSRFKVVYGYPYPVANSLSCRISNRQTGWWSSLAAWVLLTENIMAREICFLKKLSCLKTFIIDLSAAPVLRVFSGATTGLSHWENLTERT